MSDSESKKPQRIAPFVVIGAMVLIAVIGLSVVLYNHFSREEPYLEPELMNPRDPNRLDTPTTPGN